MSPQPPSTSPDTQARRCVLVMGMHRSGTSMLTGILGQLGCALPAKLLPANFANERGYFEPWDMCNLNDEILQAAGSRWDDWVPLPEAWFDSPDAAAFQGQADALLDQEYGTEPLFAIKEPRLCRLMPIWRKAFAARQVDPAVIHILRNPFEVAASLEKRDGITPAFGMLMWLHHVLEAEYVCRKFPRVFISYGDLLRDWQGVMHKVGTDLDIDWPRSPEMAAADVETFVSSGLRHFSLPSETVLNDPDLSDWVRDTFGILHAWSQTGVQQSDYARLDDIRTQLGRSALLFGQLVADGQEAVKELTARQKEFDQTQAQRGQMTALTDDLRKNISRARKDLAQSRAEADGLQAALENERRVSAYLRFEKTQFYNSTSWRITGPVRWLKNLLTR